MKRILHDRDSEFKSEMFDLLSTLLCFPRFSVFSFPLFLPDPSCYLPSLPIYFLAFPCPVTGTTDLQKETAFVIMSKI